MTYEIVFDAVSRSSFNLSKFSGSVVLGGGLLIYCVYRLMHLKDSVFDFIRGARLASITIVCLFLLGSAIKDLWYAWVPRNAVAYYGDDVKQIEGKVQEHWIKQKSRDVGTKVETGKLENFRIAHTRFQYFQDDERSDFFSNAGDPPLSLEEGLRLRVAYVTQNEENRIVRLEIVRE